jgi:hypothetical protein
MGEMLYRGMPEKFFTNEKFLYICGLGNASDNAVDDPEASGGDNREY